MLLIAHSRPTPEENLAFDESLIEVSDRIASSDTLDAAEPSPIEILRLWEMPKTCVVLGRASRLEDEVFTSRCEQDNVPVLRRVSGGATIVAGPGCLMYSVLISYVRRPSWRMLDVAHSEVMQRVAQSVQNTLDVLDVKGIVQLDGTCDLTIGGKKFSGNALRCKRNWMLYHGTIMVSMSPDSLSTYLKNPPRQPDYRGQRSHEDFVTRLIDPARFDALGFQCELENQLERLWSITGDQLPENLCHQFEAKTQDLLAARYSRSDWNRSR